VRQHARGCSRRSRSGAGGSRAARGRRPRRFHLGCAGSFAGRAPPAHRGYSGNLRRRHECRRALNTPIATHFRTMDLRGLNISLRSDCAISPDCHGGVGAVLKNRLPAAGQVLQLSDRALPGHSPVWTMHAAGTEQAGNFRVGWAADPELCYPRRALRPAGSPCVRPGLITYSRRNTGCGKEDYVRKEHGGVAESPRPGST
jgi:hypothetical protein